MHHYAHRIAIRHPFLLCVKSSSEGTTPPLDEVIEYLFYNHDLVNPTTTLTVLEK